MELKPLAGLTRTLCILLKITIAIMALGVLVDIYDYYSYANLPPYVDPNETILPSDIVTGIIGLIQVVLGIITVITFLRWIYRTNKNLRALTGEPMTFTPGWAVGWFFIPFANLYKPYQVMKEIWQVSHKQAVMTTIVGWWWAIWLISNFIGFKLAILANDATGYIATAMIYIVSDGLDVVLNIVELMLVTQIGMAYSKNFIEQDAPKVGDSSTHLPHF